MILLYFAIVMHMINSLIQLYNRDINFKLAGRHACKHEGTGGYIWEREEYSVKMDLAHLF